MGLLTVSGSPHIHGNQNVNKIMWQVVLAMVPAALVSFWYFGLSSIILMLVAIVGAVTVEYLIAKFLLKITPTINDGSAVITAILLAFNVPSSLPWWQMLIGVTFAIAIAKMTFGGLGKNPFNPALAGRVFMLISFPVDMTTWPKPGLPFDTMNFSIDGLTGPTTLGIVKEGLAKGDTMAQVTSQLPDYTQMFMGQIGGSLGEVSAIALILGGLYLLIRKVITWHIPVSFLLSAFVFAGILYLVDPTQYIDPVFHLLAGGMMLGAFFMATDMVTSPMSVKGQLFFGLGCGVLTILIRVWGAYPEGVSFAILIMNAFTPLINKGFKPKSFGR
jgi:electron transport complex protein RnfD